MKKNKIVNRRSAGPIVKGITNIIRDLKSKPATKSGKKARRRLTEEDKPATKIAKRRNIKRDPKTGRLSTEGNKEQQIVVQQPKSKTNGRKELKTVATERGTGRLGKTAAAAEKRVKARERRRVATKAGAGAAAAAVAATPFIGDDSKEAKAKSSSKSYTVKKGDTLSEIARDNGTTLKKLKAANPKIKDLNKIKPGQKIKIPMPKVKNRKSVYQGMTKSEMKKISKQGGGNLKPVDTQKNPGLAKLPTNVRNSMGYAKSGGKVVSRKGGGMVGSGNDLVASMYD